jgi:hypothetical protein
MKMNLKSLRVNYGFAVVESAGLQILRSGVDIEGEGLQILRSGDI